MSSVSLGFDVPLEAELDTHAETRVNALASVVAERASALRWSLRRVNEIACDAYTTVRTPGFPPGVPIEIKAVRLTHNGGSRTGRLGIHVDSHTELVEQDGWYAVVLYVDVELTDGERAVLALELDLVPAHVVDAHLPAEGSSDYQKVRWDLLLEAAAEDLDLARWGLET